MAHLTNSRLGIPTRERAIKNMRLVYTTLLYGCEAWTVSRKMENRMEPMEMWCWRRMLKVGWTRRRSDVSILETVGSRGELMTVVRTEEAADDFLEPHKESK